MAQSLFGDAFSSSDQPMPGLLGGFLDTLQSPTTLGGLALLSGGGWDGFQGAVNSGLQMQKQRQVVAERQAIQNAVGNMSNLSPSDRALFQASPDAASDFLARTLAERYSPGFSTEQALRKAQVSEANANVLKSNAEVAAMYRQNALLQRLLPGLLSNGGSGAGAPITAPPTPTSMIGSGAQPLGMGEMGNTSRVGSGTPALSRPNTSLPGPSLQPPAGSLLDMQPPPPGSAASPQPPVNSLFDMSSGVPGTAVGPQSANGPSPSLPNPGDPTSFTGASASGMVTPGRLSPDTMKAAAFDLALNGGKGMSSIINNDPGSQYARTFANKTAEDNASLNFKQKMTAPLLAQIQNMRQLATDAGADVLTKATGPDYTEGTDPNSWLPTLGMDTSGQRYQNLRAWGHWADFPGRALGFDDAQSYDQAAKLNLQFQHLKKMIGAQVKALPGSKGGGASTDQDQALVLDAVGEALHAQDPETFFKILHDAENGLRARAGQAPLARPKSFLPESWGSSQPSGAANNDGTAQALAGARDAIAKGANPASVRQRLIQNGINPDGL